MRCSFICPLIQSRLWDLRLRPVDLLRWERAQVCRDRDNVILGKVRNHFLHQSHTSAGARSVLNADELARYIHGLQASDSRHFTEALQFVPVTDCALNRFAGTAGLYERLSLSDATRRNVSQKGGVWIAIRCSE